MILDIFSELKRPGPFAPDHEARLFAEAIGHSGVLAPFRINHPLRVAQRAAWIDLDSNGRLEMGLARSGGTEWEAFGVDAETSRDQLREALLILPRMWTQESFSWESAHVVIPERNVVPKPLLKPHPPLWQTATTPALSP